MFEARIKKLRENEEAVEYLAQGALMIGLTAITCAIVAYILTQVGTSINNANVTLIVNYGITAMVNLAMWLGIIAIVMAAGAVIQYVRHGFGGAQGGAPGGL